MVITVINGGVSSGGQTIITNGDATGADVGGLSVAEQQDWAWEAARDCYSARDAYIKRFLSGNINYAIGFLLEPKYMKPRESYGPILGKGLDQSGHSEQKVVNYWSKVRIPLLSRRALETGDHLILLIFSRNHVCTRCLSMVPTWRTALAAAGGIGITLHFYLWESDDPYSPVSLDNLRQALVLS